jgi:hypothetical protein
MGNGRGAGDAILCRDPAGVNSGFEVGLNVTFACGLPPTAYKNGRNESVWQEMVLTSLRVACDESGSDLVVRPLARRLQAVGCRQIVKSR